MRALDRLGMFKDGQLTLGACLSLAALATVLGLLAMLIVPLSPPDAAFAERVAKWRLLGPTPR